MSRRKTGALRAVAGALGLALVGAVLTGGYLWSQQQYYVAADGPQVAIFRGVQMELPGVELSRPYEVDDLKLDELPPFNQKQVEDGIVADDLQDARRIVENLNEQADEPADEPSDTPSDKPDEKRTREPSDDPSPRASDSPTRRAAPAAGETGVVR